MVEDKKYKTVILVENKGEGTAKGVDIYVSGSRIKNGIHHRYDFYSSYFPEIESGDSIRSDFEISFGESGQYKLTGIASFNDEIAVKSDRVTEDYTIIVHRDFAKIIICFAPIPLFVIYIMLRRRRKKNDGEKDEYSSYNQ